MTDTPLALSRTLPADRYHTGVRAVTLLMWLILIVVFYLVLAAIGTRLFGEVAGLGVFIVLALSVVLAQPVAWMGEHQLLGRWSSGRALDLQPGALVWHDHGTASRIDLGQKLNWWRWRFAIGRRRGGRIPGNHHCFAIRLVQGDTVVTLYTFFSPVAAEALSTRYSYYELRRPNDSGKTALGGRDAIFMAAEHSRWEDGAELDSADFEALLDHITAALPEFPRSAQASV